MSDKKRKKSYTVRMKRQQAAEEKQRRADKKKEIILMCVIGVLIVAIAFGIVFGGRAIYRSLQSKDYCVYRDDTETVEAYKKTYTADIKIKDYGTVRVLLVHDAAPLTVNKFIDKAHSGFYNGLTISEVKDGLTVLGGDPKGDGTGGYTDAEGELVTLEGVVGSDNTIKHIRGVFSMVSMDEDNSTSSQFLICTASNKKTEEFDSKHTAIGFVTSGLKIIDQINEDLADYANTSGLITDKTKQIVIESIKIIDFAQGSDNELPLDPI